MTVKQQICKTLQEYHNNMKNCRSTDKNLKKLKVLVAKQGLMYYYDNSTVNSIYFPHRETHLKF